MPCFLLASCSCAPKCNSWPSACRRSVRDVDGLALLPDACWQWCSAPGAAEAFTETTEFVRAIHVAAPKAEDDGSYMDVDEQPPTAAAAAAPTPLPPPPPESKPPAAKQRKYRKGGWVSAGSADGEEEAEQVRRPDCSSACAKSIYVSAGLRMQHVLERSSRCSRPLAHFRGALLLHSVACCMHVSNMHLQGM